MLDPAVEDMDSASEEENSKMAKESKERKSSARKKLSSVDTAIMEYLNRQGSADEQHDEELLYGKLMHIWWNLFLIVEIRFYI